MSTPDYSDCVACPACGYPVPLPGSTRAPDHAMRPPRQTGPRVSEERLAQIISRRNKDASAHRCMFVVLMGDRDERGMPTIVEDVLFDLRDERAACRSADAMIRRLVTDLRAWLTDEPEEQWTQGAWLTAALIEQAGAELRKRESLWVGNSTSEGGS